ncbi:MAG: hypothetical protein K8T90_16180 [Planctomycetes bacterium]|nr:hypothetical protein [Planctomycetota bacterium]
MTIRTSALAALLAGSAVFATVAPSPAPARADDAPKVDAKPSEEKSAEAAKAIDDIKAKMAKPEEAESKAAITKLVTIWKDGTVSDAAKKPVPDLLEHFGREFDMPAVATAALDGLGELGPAAAGKPLREIVGKAVDAKNPPTEIVSSGLRAMKKVADPSKATTGFLLDLLKRKENDVVAKAADAVSGYKDAAGDVRKGLMEEVLKTGESVFAASRDGKNSAAVAKWNAIQGGVMAALKALSGQNLADPLAARKWYNDHKKDAKVWG